MGGGGGGEPQPITVAYFGATKSSIIIMYFRFSEVIICNRRE